MEAALKSTEFKKYLNAAAELEKLDLTPLSQDQKVSFFLNVYQCMYVHHFLRKVYEEGQASADGTNKSNGYLGYIKSYVFAYSPKPFYYKIGHHNYTLE